MARAVFPGKQDELRQRSRGGQEDQLGGLGLVVNMIVLWNTLYINAALEQLARERTSRYTRRCSRQAKIRESEQRKVQSKAN
jgi:TnpA family transposase